jgi:hypothetical protein
MDEGEWLADRLEQHRGHVRARATSRTSAPGSRRSSLEIDFLADPDRIAQLDLAVLGGD